MFNKKIISAAALFSMLGANAQGVELGEFNGTQFSFGGYLKAEGRFIDPDSADKNFEGSARQSRLNFTTKRSIDDHQVTGFVEGDFYGSNASGSTYDWRLRHAYIKVDNLTVGQTWSGQFLAVVPYDVKFLDFFNSGKGNAGGNGDVVRPDLVIHYKLDGLRLSMQEPINDEADYPDFVANYAHSFNNGLALSVALAGRDVAKSNVTNDSDNSELGLAFLYAGKYSFGSTSLHLNGYTGEGQGVYSGFGYGGAYNPAIRPAVDANSNGELVKTTGLVVGASHQFTKDIKGAVRHARIKADETVIGVDDTLDITHVNVVYSHLSGVDFGIEWRDQNFGTHPTRPAGQQVEVMAMYKF